MHGTARSPLHAKAAEVACSRPPARKRASCTSVRGRWTAVHHGIWLAACVWCSAGRCAAQPAAELDIALRAGATCLEAAPLRQQVEAWLKQPVGSKGLRIEVQGSAHDPRSVLVHLYAGRTELARRSFSPGPAACADLHSAVALAIALMVKIAEGAPGDQTNPDEPARPPQELPTARAHPTAPPAPPPARSRHASFDALPTAQRATTRGRDAASLSAAGLLAVGVDAALAGGFQSELAVSVSRAIELRAGLIGLFSRPRALADTGGTFSLRTLAGSLAGCACISRGASFRARVCPALWAGRAHAEGAHFARSLDATLPWLAAALELELGWRLADAWWLLADVSPVASLRSAQIVARDGEGTIAARTDLPRFAAIVGLGLAYSFQRRTAGAHRKE
jgi:hypothetical protein